MSVSVKSKVEMFENLGKEKSQKNISEQLNNKEKANQIKNSNSKEEIKEGKLSENIEEDELEQLEDIEPGDEEVDEEKKREEMLDKLERFDITIEYLEEKLKKMEEEIKELEGDKVEQLYVKEDAELCKLTIDLVKVKEKIENYLRGGELPKEGYELLEEFSKKYDFLQNYENYTERRYRIWSGESKNYDADFNELESSVNKLEKIDLLGDYAKCRESAKELKNVTKGIVICETEKEIQKNALENEKVEAEKEYQEDKIHEYEMTINSLKKEGVYRNILTTDISTYEGVDIEWFQFNWKEYYEAKHDILRGQSKNYSKDLKRLESSVAQLKKIDLPDELYKQKKELAEKGEAKAKAKVREVLLYRLLDKSDKFKNLRGSLEEILHNLEEFAYTRDYLEEGLKEREERIKELEGDKLEQLHVREEAEMYKLGIDLAKVKEKIENYLSGGELPKEGYELLEEFSKKYDFLQNYENYIESRYRIWSGESKNYDADFNELESSVSKLEEIDLPDNYSKCRESAKELMNHAEEVIRCEIEIEGLKYALADEKEEAMKEYLKDKIHFWEMNLDSIRKEGIYLYEPKNEIERENTRVFQSLWEKYSDVKYSILSGKSENYSEDLEDLEAIVAHIKSIDLSDEIYKQKKELAEKGEAKVKETLHLNKIQENEKKQEAIKITPILNNTEEVTVDYIKQRKTILNHNMEEIEKHYNTLDIGESKDYDNHKKSYDLAEKGYNKAEKEYNEAEKRYTQAEKKEKEANKEYNEEEKAVTKAKEKEKGAEEKYNEAKNNEAKAFNDMTKANQELKTIKYEYSDAKRKFDTIDGEYKKVKRKYNVTKKYYEETEKKYNEAKGKYNETDRKYKEAEKDYKEAEKNYNEIEKNYNEIEKNYKEAEGKYNEVEKKKNEIEKKYNDAMIQLDEKRNAKLEAMDFKRKTYKERSEAEGKYNDAKSKKNEAEREKRGASEYRNETYKQLQKEEAWLIDKYSAFGNAIERINKEHNLEQGIDTENENKAEKLNESQNKDVNKKNLVQPDDREPDSGALKRKDSGFSDSSIIKLSQLQKDVEEVGKTVSDNKSIINNTVEVKKTKEVMINYQDKTINYQESKGKTIEEKKNDTKLVALKIVEGLKKQTKDMSNVQSVNIEYSGGLYKLEVNRKDNSLPEVYRISRDDFERSGMYKFGKPEAPNMFLNGKISTLNNAQKLKMSELSNKIKELEDYSKQHNKDKDTAKNYFTK